MDEPIDPGAGDDEPLVAPREDSTTWSSGITLVESVETLAASIEAGSWIDGSVAGLAAALDVAATVIDPLGSLAAAGLGWLIEHVEPLSDVLDQLTGDPDAVAAQARTWRQVAGAVGGVADDLARAAAPGPGWDGPAAAACARSTADHAERLRGTARAAQGIGAAVEGAGRLVAAVRDTVRDLIAQLVATLLVRVPQWAAEEVATLGLATPHVVASALAVVARVTARVVHLAQGLLRSVARLGELVADLSRVLARLGDDLARHRPNTAPGPSTAPTTPTAGAPSPERSAAAPPPATALSGADVSPGHGPPGAGPSPIRDALEPRAPDGRVPIHRDRHGVVTDGRYKVGSTAQDRHRTGVAPPGRSRFRPELDLERLALDLARRADRENLWVPSNPGSPSGDFPSKAKIVLDRPIGIHGASGGPTTVVNVYRNRRNTIHISPGSPE